MKDKNTIVSAAYARHNAYMTMFSVIVTLFTVLCLDVIGRDSNYFLNHFMSEHVYDNNGAIMIGVFILMGISSLCYSFARFQLYSLSKNSIVVTTGTLVFGIGMFIGGCFNTSTPNMVDPKLLKIGDYHMIGISLAFMVGSLAQAFDFYPNFKRRTTTFLSYLSEILTTIGCLGFALLLLSHGHLDFIRGLIQRTWALGLLLWLFTEAHTIFWKSTLMEESEEIRSYPFDNHTIIN
jgi:hypothetical protein